MQEDYSLVKIFSSDMQVNQVEKFEFSTKGYSEVSGIMVSGQAETSLVFSSNSSLVIHSLAMDSSKKVVPNARLHRYIHKVENELITGSVIKKDIAGRVSVYAKVK